MQRLYQYLIVFLALVPGISSASETLDSMKIERVRVPLEYRVDGVVEARQQATLSAEVAGKVEAVYFDVDDYVEKGQVVLRIRDREYRARQQQASAALDEATAGLREAASLASNSQPPKKRTSIRVPVVAYVSRRCIASQMEARVFSSAQTAA